MDSRFYPWVEGKPTVLRNIQVPTGNILVIEGSNGPIELLSIGDYGNSLNVKADFLGLTRKIEGVPNTSCMPLEEKWVITISTQAGCSMKCMFCDVPLVGKGRNVSVGDIINQLLIGLSLHPEVKSTKRLNLHYARMGEPSFNFNVLEGNEKIIQYFRQMENRFVFHPVITTMMPASNVRLEEFLTIWLRDHKNGMLDGEAGLQLSINSTDDLQRVGLFGACSTPLPRISEMMKRVIDNSGGVRGRKIALNFPITDQTICNGSRLRELFDPQYFMVKITPIHETRTSSSNGLKTSEGYQHYTPYEDAEKSFKDAGFDTLVFVPSLDEDKSLITCGNAILSGALPTCEYKELV
jgi:23S rRNA (adenine2503-C2)-methyltransferase